MDTAEKAMPPWWRRKRIWATLVLLLAIAYPLGGGPAVYAVCRGWASWPAVRVVWPSIKFGGYTRIHPWYDAYLEWWMRRAIEENFRQFDSD